jgi:two-component system, LytTR family, sensor kinase
MKEFIKVCGISIIIAVILFFIDMIFQYSAGNEVVFDFDLVIKFGYFIMYSLPLTFVNSYFFDFLHHKTKNTLFIKNKIVFGFTGSIILTLAAMFLVRLFHRTILDGLTYSEFIQSESLQIYITTLLITFTASLFFHAFYFYQELQKNKVKEQKIIAGTASAKFDALKNQLDPHFLFNSLNVLTSLIEENTDNAQKFTTSLSKVYRYVLEQKNKDLVTVDEELEFAKTYMSLLKMRFEDSLIFDIPEKASNPESKVVPLSLQLLLENAVKHNIVTANKPLHIKIYEVNGTLVVENNLQPKQIVKKGSGVGLSNIMQRYQLLTNKKVNINQEAKSFAVAIPMLTKQVKIMRTQSTSQIDDGYVRARKHVEELKEFYYSLISYCVVIPFLIFIWYRFTPDTIQWFWFPMFGWGMGLCFQAYKVFVNNGVLGRNWEQRKIDEFMQEEEKQNWN